MPSYYLQWGFACTDLWEDPSRSVDDELVPASILELHGGLKGSNVTGSRTRTTHNCTITLFDCSLMKARCRLDVSVDSKSHTSCLMTLRNNIATINYSQPHYGWPAVLMRAMVGLIEALINKYFYVNIHCADKMSTLIWSKNNNT